jgi:VIT1/CCC1 family predicted Fe2+/Mn2+ transporter
MILLGVILLVLGFVFTVHILWILGIVLLVVGLVLALLGAGGREFGGRRHWF